MLAGLRQDDVPDGESYEWDHLEALWPLMAAGQDDWDLEPARSREDRHRRGWQRVVARGGPPHLGKGPGGTEGYDYCLYGATLSLAADLSLAEVGAQLASTARHLVHLAQA